MPELFAVAGKPVLHSKSPQMFNAAFIEKGVNGIYTRISSDNPLETLDLVKEIGFSGFNVTSPLKEKMASFLDDLDESSKKIGAVNTILVRGKKLVGYNTDYLGVVFALKKNGVKIKGKRAVVIGAGGAGKAAALGLASNGANVLIANRTHKKALSAAKKIGCTAVRLGEVSEEIKNADILISCTSSKKPPIDLSCLHNGLVVLDANYAFDSELFLKAKQKGCKLVDGKQWLVFQAALAFKIFTGKKASVPLMMKATFFKDRPVDKNIALIGFMGSGKTVAGKKLSELSSKKFFDTDLIIEEKFGKRIKNIFDENGPGFFRKIEKKELKKASKEKNAVVSCGGGVVLNDSNVSILNKKFDAFWLYASPKDIVERIKNDDSRPLLFDPDKENTIQRLLKNRRENYALASSVIIGTSNKSPLKVARGILSEIRATK